MRIAIRRILVCLGSLMGNASGSMKLRKQQHVDHGLTDSSCDGSLMDYPFACQDGERSAWRRFRGTLKLDLLQ